MKRALLSPWLVSLLGIALLAAAGCGGEAPVPKAPTWVDDVMPILRANCFTCHGAGVRDKDAKRWDFFYDPDDPKLGDINLPIGFMSPVTLASGRWPLWLILKGGDRMPPVPALPLSERDAQVLKLFQMSPKRGTRPANHTPKAGWFPKAPWFVVSDDDGEQVLGKLTCGSVEVLIDHTGNQRLPAGASPPCTGLLYDGQDLQAVTLD